MITSRFPLLRRVLCVLSASVASSALYAAPAQLPGYEIVHLGRGHLNRLMMAASIEGKKGLLVVDTGAYGTFLGEAKYGSLLPSADRQLPAGVPKTTSFNGRTVPVAYARDFHIGSTNLGSLPLCIVPQRFLFDAAFLYQHDKGHDYDGYLGEDILRHCGAILDVGHLILYLNVDPRKKTNPGASLVAAGWTKVPLSDFGRDLAVECKLGDKTYRAIVDTGAPFTVFDSGAVANAHARVTELPIKLGVVATRAQRSSLADIDSFRIGDYVATNAHIVSQPGISSFLKTNYNDSSPLAGCIGGDILAKHNAIIDVGNHALYLKHSAAR